MSMGLLVLTLLNKSLLLQVPFLVTLLRFVLVSLLLFSSSSSLLSTGKASSISTSQPCIHDHFSALLQLKQGFYFGAFSSTTLSSWNPNDTDCCSWEGITCDDPTGHVISLDLNNRQISGQIDFGILFRLDSLRELNLAYNYFDPSPFPSGFDQLNSLTHLNLSTLQFHGQIPMDISRLPNLISLDLSYNCIFTDCLGRLENPSIGTLVQNLSSLEELYLDNVDISAHGSEWCHAVSSSLPRLRKLSLMNCGLSGPIHPSLSRLHFLSELHLSENNLSSVVLDFIGDLSSITTLRLKSCELYGKFPKTILRLPNLHILDISYNPLLNLHFSDWSPNNTLKELSISSTRFGGKSINLIGNLRFLKALVARNCNFSGSLPSSLENLTNLEQLDLSNNNLSGPIPFSYFSQFRNLKMLYLYNNALSGTIPASLFSLPSLQHLDLSENQFSGLIDEFSNASFSLLEGVDLDYNNLQGPIPKSLLQLPMLRTLWLSSNNFTGVIEPDAFQNLKNLSYLNLGNNSFSGPIPNSIFELSMLETLVLSGNDFIGYVDLSIFQNQKRLAYLDLSDNHLSVKDGSSSSTFIFNDQIRALRLRSCNITKFPNILRNQESIYVLDLSKNQIKGEIPKWIWEVGNLSLLNLNLSHNSLNGPIPPLTHFSLSSLLVLDLSFNMLQGSLPMLPPSVIFFSVSKNYLSQQIPSQICSATYLQALDLSDNNFSGLIPQCLGENGGALIVLNLRRNAFHGSIPDTFQDGCQLQTLDLSGNRLEGKVPRSLANCRMLEVLNLGSNSLNDAFPSWLENLSHLRVLVLRSNKFFGAPFKPPLANNASFPMLQIIDLASNSFSGRLPENIFGCWKTMIEESESQDKYLDEKVNYYQDTVTVTSKGLTIELERILVAFTLIDLSNNEFQGDIPESIGILKALHALNMSNNNFKGRIPISLANLSNLESLDLSQNNLSGEIPSQLLKLTFLAVFNVSNNHLVGAIPQGQQFSTFSNASFQGNPELCGPPLTRTCEETEDEPQSAESESLFDWRLMWIGFGAGYGVGLGMFLSTLVLWTKGKIKYIKFIDRMLSLIFPNGVFAP